MGRVIEESSFRERRWVFKDRHEAGIMLASALTAFKDTDGIVLAIPSGGVPVATEIASALALPLELVIVRKVQVPFNPEAGFGAAAPDGEVILNDALLQEIRLSRGEIEGQIQETRMVIDKRDLLFRGNRPFPLLDQKTAIIVDDGLASGYTMLAAVQFVRRRAAKRVIVAVPTGSERTVSRVLTEVDELYCLNVRSGYPFAVADAYRRWYDLSDGEVLELIRAHEN